VILADTSAWVEFDRASGSPVDVRLGELVAGSTGLAITEPVVMEVCAGARDRRRERDLRRLLGAFPLLTFDPASDFDSAVTVYRTCRRAGVTPRGLIDCMIAAIAWRHGASVLAQDRDLVLVAGVVGLELDPATLAHTDASN
jgi:predicted nucleic acid-binding protein